MKFRRNKKVNERKHENKGAANEVNINGDKNTDEHNNAGRSSMVWNISRANLDSPRKSANKFVVLQSLKQALKRLSQKNGNLFEIASMFKEKLKEVRGKVDKDFELRKKLLINVLKEYNEAVPDEEKLLYQLAKVDWLKEGDKNSACFHELIRGKRHRSYIYNVGDEVLLNLSNTSK
ncbi:hypothetical protein Tco_1305772 [Tanacetum coccineum]